MRRVCGLLHKIHQFIYLFAEALNSSSKMKKIFFELDSINVETINYSLTLLCQF